MKTEHLIGQAAPELDPNIFAQHPWLLWVPIVLFILGAVGTLSDRVRKIISPLSAWFDSREEKKIDRRRRQIQKQRELDDVRLADAEETIQWLKDQRERDRLDRVKADERHAQEIAELRSTIEELRTELTQAHNQITAMAENVAATRHAVEQSHNPGVQGI